MKRAKAFTLVEILIVVVLLGVLAAIVIPSIAGSTTSARQTTLSMNIALLRRFIAVYQSQHLEVAPGYPNGNASAAPTQAAFIDQATLSSKITGETAARGTPGFGYGPYLSKVPENPFNHLDTILALANDADFPVTADDSYGWIYKAATGEIKPGNSGNDGLGRNYYEY